MTRIPQEEIDHIKRTVRVEELVRAAGVELRGSGENLIGKCRWHEDSTASLIVTPSKNLWHCMGACQIGGDAYAWVMKSQSVNFPQAHAELRKIAPPMIVVSPLRQEMSDDEIMRAIVDYYVMRGQQRSEFGRYLEKRGIDSPEMIERFSIGYAPANPSLVLPTMPLKEETLFRARLQKLGIMRAPRAIEHMAGSLVVPIFDADGNVVEMYGRKIRDDLRPGTAYHLYLPGPHRGVWNLDALRESKEIILCEAAIDALTFWRWGFRNVTWSYGVEGFTAEHTQAFKAYGVERVLIAYDRDEAGDRAAEKLATKLRAEGIDCYRVEFPKGMDANDYARKVTPADKSLALVIKNAALMGMGHAREVDPDPPPPAAQNERESEPVIEASKPAPPLAAVPVEISRNVKPLASPLVEPPRDLDIDARNENEVFVTFGDRSYRIRGMKKNTSFESLRINVMLTRETNKAVYLDTFDLSVNRQRAMFERSAAVEIGVKEEVLHREMGQILCALERIRDEAIARAQEKKTKLPEMTAEDRARALDYLMAPRLVGRIQEDLRRCGLVGEEVNKLMTYLACTSRKLAKPLAEIIQSSSAAGKTKLMDTVLAFMPPEDVVRYSAITGKALFYIPEPDALKHKILAISEEQGAEQATYSLKLLQSEGKLSIASTGKDPHTGRLESQEYHVEGPIMPLMTTTAPEIDEELQNRCIVVTADETQEQTRAIHELQREAHTIEGLLAGRESNEIQRNQQNVQRLLRPIMVAIPQARGLTFLDSRTRTRRDHMKYLTLICTIALLHQYQREHKHAPGGDGVMMEYIEVTLDDIALANELAHEVLGRSLDELAPQTRKLLCFLGDLVTARCERMKLTQAECFFTQREVREFTGWSDTQVKRHLLRLVEMEYVLVHRGGRGQSFVYELLYRGEGERGRTFMMGLIDVQKLRATESNRGGAETGRGGERPKRGGVGAGQVRPKGGPGAAPPIAAKPSADAVLRESEARSREKTLQREPREDEPVTSGEVTPLAIPKPAKKVKRYVLRRGFDDGGNGRAPLMRATLYRRWPRPQRKPQETE